ncbi:MAG: TlpA family protein disulfide reductase [Labilithrix sp.]|nr:TlpA family protein disulfide reductase [Labilithrix sp.]
MRCRATPRAVAVASAESRGARGWISPRGLFVSALFAGALLACGPKQAGGPPIGVSTKDGAPLPSPEKATHYAFDPIDERPVSSEANRGKPTVIVFVTTGDIIGQAQVSYLVHMAKNDADRVNYAVVALHPRKEIVLVDAYRTTLGVDFPVALGDHSATNAAGPFGEIPAVPTVVILDREGRIVWKHTGLAKNDELRGHMRGL